MVVNIGPLLHEKVDRIFPIAQARGSIPRASRWCPIYDRQSRETATIRVQVTRLKREPGFSELALERCNECGIARLPTTGITVAVRNRLLWLEPLRYLGDDA
jgi:hypothetical protein